MDYYEIGIFIRFVKCLGENMVERRPLRALLSNDGKLIE
jgi:hypothetical protein